jgi:DNA-binding winged helix-turn-helix (wHTH) protein
MGEETYLINNRFLVDLQVHSAKDMHTEVEHHLEPRLIGVLSALLKKPGILVTREMLIKEIWNDYAGAEEGLTQAISSLRRLLADDAKEVVKTIPKKGYILTAPVARQSQAAPASAQSKSRQTVFYVVAAGCIMAVSLFLLTFNFTNGINPSSQEKQKSTEVVFPGTGEEDDTNYLNTITTTDSSGNRYRLIMIGDRRPKFYINDRLQPDTEGYTGLVDKLAKELWRRQKEAEDLRK